MVLEEMECESVYEPHITVSIPDSLIKLSAPFAATGVILVRKTFTSVSEGSFPAWLHMELKASGFNSHKKNESAV